MVSNSSLLRLVQLQRLNLADNNFNFSQIPSEFSRLSRLTYLNLSNSLFSGNIPSKFSDLSKLTSLDFSYNSSLHLRSLKDLVQNLTGLKDLRLRYVQISSPVPEILSNLSGLTTLYLVGNGFYGEFPVGIFKLPKLQDHRVTFNEDLTGSLPEFCFSSPLKILWLWDTAFSGKLPASIGNLDSLKELYIGVGNFWGSTPPSIGNLTRLTTLLSGSIPDSFGNLTQLTHLGLSQNFIRILDLRFNKLQALPQIPPPATTVYLVANNMIQEQIPSQICSLSSLSSIDLSNNKFRGILPDCLRNFSSSLSILNLRGNIFHGVIPQLCAKGSIIKMIDLSQNQFTGILPRSLSNCGMLEILNLGSNQLKDVFPSWLGTLPELSVLILRHNGFQGVVGSPTTMFEAPKLHILDLSANKFTGFFMHEYYPYSMVITNKGQETIYSKIIEALAIIDLSSNEFITEIPEFIGSLNGFQLLNLSKNNLTGHIPISLGNLTTLECLDISQNKLSGQVPWQLTQLIFLASFNVSHNQLTGPIPYGKQFNTFDTSSFDGNLGLCGYPLSKKCENLEPAALPTSNIEEDQDSWFHIEFDWIIVLMGYGSGGLVIGVVVGIIVLKKNQHWFRTWKRQLC
ncbi:receptor-like protein 43 [Quercus robur]|uniref:receptor-like protein 43 n=1 Tax=Quercus robur TaxID=38942 RepID=UPI002162B92B|nr:receptor-like protein 43 [Quercus robur]